MKPSEAFRAALGKVRVFRRLRGGRAAACEPGRRARPPAAGMMSHAAPVVAWSVARNTNHCALPFE